MIENAKISLHILKMISHKGYTEGLVQDYSNASAIAMGLQDSCTKPSI